MRKFVVALLIAVPLAVMPGASCQQVRVHGSASGLNSSRTFVYIADAQSDLSADRVRDAVVSELESRGWRLVVCGGDFVVRVSSKVNARRYSQPFDYQTAGTAGSGGYDFPVAVNPPKLVGGFYLPAVYRPKAPHENEFEESVSWVSKIVVTADVTDPGTGKSLWNTRALWSATRKTDSPPSQDMDDLKLGSAVDKMFKKFPVTQAPASKR